MSKIAMTRGDFRLANFGVKFVPRFHGRERRNQFEKVNKTTFVAHRELTGETYSHGAICSNNL